MIVRIQPITRAELLARAAELSYPALRYYGRILATPRDWQEGYFGLPADRRRLMQTLDEIAAGREATR